MLWILSQYEGSTNAWPMTVDDFVEVLGLSLKNKITANAWSCGCEGILTKSCANLLWSRPDPCDEFLACFSQLLSVLKTCYGNSFFPMPSVHIVVDFSAGCNG